MEVVSTDFKMPLWEALALVRSSDVVLGIHGAGFTNLLGMLKVGLWVLTLRIVVVELYVAMAMAPGAVSGWRLSFSKQCGTTMRCHRAETRQGLPWSLHSMAMVA